MCNLLLQFQADIYRWPMWLRLLVWERRRQWEFSLMSLESNRKSSTCKYLPRFDLWSKYLTTSAVHFWQNQIFTNLPKEPELRDLSHKHNCKKLPYFEDFWFVRKVSEQQISRWNENSSKTGMTPENPVESHSNDFFPVGSLLYCISLLRLDQVKEKLEIGTIRFCSL